MVSNANMHKASQISAFLYHVEYIDLNALYAYEALMSVFDFTATYLVGIAIPYRENGWLTSSIVKHDQPWECSGYPMVLGSVAPSSDNACSQFQVRRDARSSNVRLWKLSPELDRWLLQDC